MNPTSATLAQMENGSFHERPGSLVSGTFQSYSISNAHFVAGGDVECTVFSAPGNMTDKCIFIYAFTGISIGEFKRCNKVVLKNVTFQGTPAPVFKGTDLGEVEVTNVKTDPVAYFMNDGRGGFNFGNIEKATFTDCNLKGIGDDGINLHGIGRKVDEVYVWGSYRKTLSTGTQIISDLWAPGQKCKIMDLSDNTLLYEGTIGSINHADKRITFDSNSPDLTQSATNGYIFNDHMCGYKGLVITNNIIEVGRRNALIMTPVCQVSKRGNISGNTFEHLGMRAFYTHHDDAGGEGFRSQYVNVHDNYFNDLARANFPSNSFVYIGLLKENVQGWRGIVQVNIQTNEFLNLDGRPGIRISNAYSCDLTGNTNPNMAVPIIKFNTGANIIEDAL